MSEWTPVAVVEDDELARTGLEHSLKRYGFLVYSAKNGPAGIQLAKQKQPSFIYIRKTSDLNKLGKIIKDKWERYTINHVNA